MSRALASNLMFPKIVGLGLEDDFPGFRFRQIRNLPELVHLSLRDEDRNLECFGFFNSPSKLKVLAGNLRSKNLIDYNLFLNSVKKIWLTLSFDCSLLPSLTSFV